MFKYIILLIPFFSNAQNKVQLYIDKYSDLAIEEMVSYSIPASITLAQAILESGSGESRLASEGKNHFGIKCHNNWDGETILVDDDLKGECFRKYSNVAASYRDHSIFLSTRSRYDFLFEYSILDYKSWAKGLSKAGYATNPKYSKLLIDLIKKYNLDKYDSNDSMRNNFYFSTEIGFIYLTGLGGYLFSNNKMYFAHFQTSAIMSRINIGVNFKIINNIYIGINSGSFHKGDKFDQPTWRIGSELAYSKLPLDAESRFIYKIGVDYTKWNDNYVLLPALGFGYLIK